MRQFCGFDSNERHDQSTGRHDAAPTFEALEERTLFAANWLYAIENGGALYQIDATTGASTFVGDTGYAINDIAFAQDGRLYGIGRNALYSIDPRTGLANPIEIGLLGEEEPEFGFNSLAVDPRTEGRIYAATTNGVLYELKVIDNGFFLEDVLVQERGSFQNDWVPDGDLAFSADGELFVTAVKGEEAPFRRNLLFVNPVTGRAFGRLQPNGTVPPLGANDAEGLTLAPNGRLVTVGNGNSASPTLRVVSEATGRSFALVNITGITGGIAGLASAPIGTPLLTYLTNRVYDATGKTFGQLKNEGIKYAGYISAAFSGNRGADIYIDLADYFSSVYDTSLSPEGNNGDWVTIWVNRHDAVRGGALPFELGAVPIQFRSNAQDPPNDLTFGRPSTNYPFTRDPIVAIDTLKQTIADPGDDPTVYGDSRAIYGPQYRGSDEAAIARVEVKRQVLDQLFADALSTVPDAESPSAMQFVAAALAQRLLVVAPGQPIRFDYSAFGPGQLRSFTTSDTNVFAGNSPGGALNIGTLPPTGSLRRLGSGWVGRGAQANYFTFTLTGSTRVEIAALNLEGNANLYLESPAGTVIRQSVTPGSADETIRATLPAGTYTVRVQAAPNAETGYNLRLLTNPTAVATAAPAASAVGWWQRQQQKKAAAAVVETADAGEIIGSCDLLAANPVVQF